MRRLVGPGDEAVGELAADGGVALGEGRAHLGVAGAVQPQLELEQQPHLAHLVMATGDADPCRTDHLVEVGGVVDLGHDPRGGLLLPLLEQGQQQALLVAEVAVQRAGRAVGGVGDGFGGDGVEALAGEEVGRGREQAGTGVGLALLLGAGHCGPLGR